MPETLSLAELIKLGVRTGLLNIHTRLPGIVEKVDHDQKTVDVIPALKRTYVKNNEVVTLSVIQDVPLCFPQTGTTIISIPIKKGDAVWLDFSERSIDIWKRDGGIVDPKDPRIFDISDATATPAASPIGQGIKSHPTDILIQNGSSILQIPPDGKFELKNNSEEVLSLISELMQECANILTNTALGPQPPINAANFSALKARFDTLKK